MIFDKKYIFETRATRFRRYLKILLSMAIIPFLFYICLAVYFIYLANQYNEETIKQFYKKSPDLIAVFTGDRGRIELALKKSEEFSKTNVFITGVYNKNTIESLINRFYKESPPVFEENSDDTNSENILPTTNQETKHIDIDYLATNTLENVISTMRYLRKNPNLKNIVIISSDYHLPRIRYIVEKIRLPRETHQYFYLGIETQLDSYRNIKIILKEVYKFIKSWTFLILWTPELSEGVGDY